jgi:hypothetical protein
MVKTQDERDGQKEQFQVLCFRACAKRVMARESNERSNLKKAEGCIMNYGIERDAAEDIHENNA